MSEEVPAVVPPFEPVADLGDLTIDDLVCSPRSALGRALRRRIEERHEPGCSSVGYQRALR